VSELHDMAACNIRGRPCKMCPSRKVMNTYYQQRLHWVLKRSTELTRKSKSTRTAHLRRSIILGPQKLSTKRSRLPFSQIEMSRLSPNNCVVQGLQSRIGDLGINLPSGQALQKHQTNATPISIFHTSFPTLAQDTLKMCGRQYTNVVSY
jgi:hypothetical protein